MVMYVYRQILRTPDRQIKELIDFGVDKNNIFIDKKSGKNFDRENYQLMKRILRSGDLIYIPSLDRLGRNYSMISHEWKDITQNIKADIVILDQPLLDSRQQKDLLGTFINDLILGILSYVAETERVKIKTRQRQGIDLALSRNVKFGRKLKTKDDLLANPEFIKAYSLYKSGQINIVNMQKILGVKSRTTVYNWISIFEKGRR